MDAWGEPLYSDIKRTFGTGRSKRKKYGNKKLRAADIELNQLFVAVKDYQLEPEPTKKSDGFFV